MTKHSHDFANGAGIQTAYLYARYSSLGQKDGNSIERQTELGRAFAANRKWQIVEELQDKAVSAYSGKGNRIGVAALALFEQRAIAGDFKDGVALIVESLDRLTRRGYEDALDLLKILTTNGVTVATYQDNEIYSAYQRIDMGKALTIIVKAELAHEESSKKSDRSQDAWSRAHAKIANGDKTAYSSQCPAWLEIKDDKYVAIEHRANLLRLMYAWYCDGTGSIGIVKKLNDMGELSWSNEARYKGTKAWTFRYIHKILQSRAAIGEYVTLKGDTLSTDYYPAIIDTAVFFRAQAIRNNKANGGAVGKKTRSQNLFSGLSRCGTCGLGAVYVKREFKARTHHYLRCNHARYKSERCTNNSHANYTVVLKVVLDNVLPLVVRYKNEQNSLRSFDTQLADNQRQIELLQGQLDNLVDAIASGVASNAVAKKADSIESELEKLKAHTADVKAERGIAATKPSKNDDAAIIADMRKGLESTDTETRFEAMASINTALKRLIRAIKVNDDGTFTVVVDDRFTATYNREGVGIGYTMGGHMLNDEVLDAILIEDKDAVLNAAFKNVH